MKETRDLRRLHWASVIKREKRVFWAEKSEEGGLGVNCEVAATAMHA